VTTRTSRKVAALALVAATAFGVTACSPPHQKDSAEKVDTATSQNPDSLKGAGKSSSASTTTSTSTSTETSTVAATDADLGETSGTTDGATTITIEPETAATGEAGVAEQAPLN